MLQIATQVGLTVCNLQQHYMQDATLLYPSKVFSCCKLHTVDKFAGNTVCILQQASKSQVDACGKPQAKGPTVAICIQSGLYLLKTIHSTPRQLGHAGRSKSTPSRRPLSPTPFSKPDPMMGERICPQPPQIAILGPLRAMALCRSTAVTLMPLKRLSATRTRGTTALRPSWIRKTPKSNDFSANSRPLTRRSRSCRRVRGSTECSTEVCRSELRRSPRVRTRLSLCLSMLGAKRP